MIYCKVSWPQTCCITTSSALTCSKVFHMPSYNFSITQLIMAHISLINHPHLIYPHPVYFSHTKVYCNNQQHEIKQYDEPACYKSTKIILASNNIGKVMTCNLFYVAIVLNSQRIINMLHTTSMSYLPSPS